MRWLPLALLAGCALPPRVDDPSTPEGAYETFRSALARREHDRAYGVLSDALRGRLGVASRAEFKDGMIVIGNDLRVRAIGRSEAEGPAERLPDGRALLRIRVRQLLSGRDVRVWLRPVAVLRVWTEGSGTPVLYQHLEGLDLVVDRGVVGVRVPPGVWADLEQGVRRGTVRRFEAAVEWFLDNFEVEGGSR